MTLDELPAAIVRSGEQRRADAALSLFAAGHDFGAIADILAFMRERDEAIATAIRDDLPRLRAASLDDFGALLAAVLAPVCAE